jgi:hypothetical protein
MLRSSDRRAARAGVLLAFVAVLGGCGDDAVVPTDPRLGSPPFSVSIDTEELALELGRREWVTASVRDAGGLLIAPLNVRFTSSDEGVAIPEPYVDGFNRDCSFLCASVYARSEGVAWIIARYRGAADSMRVVVTP